MPLLHHFFCIFLLGLLACSGPVVSAADTTLTTTPEATTPTSTTGSMLTDVASATDVTTTLTTRWRGLTAMRDNAIHAECGAIWPFWRASHHSPASAT